MLSSFLASPFEIKSLEQLSGDRKSFLGIQTMGSLNSPSTILHGGLSPRFLRTPVKKRGIPAIFSVRLTRRQKDGSELCFGCSHETKVGGETVWVPLLSRVRLVFTKGFDARLFDSSRSLIGLFS